MPSNKIGLRVMYKWTSIAFLSLYLNSALVNGIQNNSETFSDSIGEGGLVFSEPSIRPNDDPEFRQEIAQKARNNEISAEIITNKTRAVVTCETGEILVGINFTEPFRGVAYADYDRNSPCKLFGEGAQYYEMRLPLKGCGTKQEAPRLFINNIILRFHRSLELEEDEVKTIVCRYPPPQVEAPPPPPGIPARVVDVPPEPAKLTQYEPFVIIAGLLFFCLLLAAVGTTSYVTKNQTLKPINTFLPIIAKTDDDTFVTKQTTTDVEDIQTTGTIIPFPKITSHVIDDVYIRKYHEIDTVEDLIHHQQTLPKSHIERLDYDDTYVTRQDEIIEDDWVTQQQLESLRRLDRLECDDAYLTNENDIIDEEHMITQSLHDMNPPKIELRTIEDTFTTKVEEVVEEVNTTHFKDRHGKHFERYDELEESYQSSHRKL